MVEFAGSDLLCSVRHGVYYPFLLIMTTIITMIITII